MYGGQVGIFGRRYYARNTLVSESVLCSGPANRGYVLVVWWSFPLLFCLGFFPDVHCPPSWTSWTVSSVPFPLKKDGLGGGQLLCLDLSDRCV